MRDSLIIAMAVLALTGILAMDQARINSQAEKSGVWVIGDRAYKLGRIQ